MSLYRKRNIVSLQVKADVHFHRLTSVTFSMSFMHKPAKDVYNTQDPFSKVKGQCTLAF